jgi:AraC family transcriptional activator of pobA
MQNRMIHRVNTITEYHKVVGLPKPEHPLISVIDYGAIDLGCKANRGYLFDFYAILIDRDFKGNLKYGQQAGIFEEGVMFFMSPGQLFEVEVYGEETAHRSGWLLLFHPDFLWKTALAKTIKTHEYFDYFVNEALVLTDKEEKSVLAIIENMALEYRNNVDVFSGPVIIAQLELLLTYADRFYQRQFITRKQAGHSILERLEALLDGYFKNGELLVGGVPTVQSVAASLNLSAGYLSGLLKTLTGKSTQHYIQDKLIEHAKAQLSTSDQSVSEIAYSLGFEHPQSFSRLFKAKTNLSPLDFRESFN